MQDKYFQQLKVVYSERGVVWAYCPYHNDKIRPNLSVSLLDKYYGKYKCWACGKTGYLTKPQMKQLISPDSLISIPVSSSNDKLIDWAEFNNDCYNNLKKFPLLSIGLAKQLNVSTKSLRDWRVGYDGISFIIPMRGGNRDRYDCGAQRRFPDGTKRCVKGSCLGYMHPREPSHYTVYLCEGFSDGISVHDLGLCSISRPHCHYIYNAMDYIFNCWAWFDNVVIIPDNDSVGMRGAETLYEKLLCEGVSCEIFEFEGAKDIREYIFQHGKDKVFEELAKNIKSVDI